MDDPVTLRNDVMSLIVSFLKSNRIAFISKYFFGVVILLHVNKLKRKAYWKIKLHAEINMQSLLIQKMSLTSPNRMF